MEKKFLFADVGEGITEGVLVRWRVAPGASVQEDDPLVDIETDKAIVEIPAPFAGKIVHLHAKEGEAVHVGHPLVTYVSAAGEVVEQAPQVQEMVPKSQAAPAAQRAVTRLEKNVLATPYVRRLARERAIDLALVPPDPRTGRVTEEGVLAFARKGPFHSPGKETAVELDRDAIFPKIDFESYGPCKRQPMMGIRQRIAHRMTMAQREIPHVHHLDEADATALLALKDKVAAQCQGQPFRLTFLPFIMKTVVQSLMRFPILNASLDGHEIVYRDYYNIGFAAHTEEGLLVPVIREVQNKSILQLAQGLSLLSDKARQHKISREEMTGHTFSITNIGSIGGKFFTPIIHYPNTAILGMGKIEQKPLVKAGQVVVRSVIPLVITFDHRIMDGATAAHFLNDVIKHLENPDLLLVAIQ